MSHRSYALIEIDLGKGSVSTKEVDTCIGLVNPNTFQSGCLNVPDRPGAALFGKVDAYTAAVRAVTTLIVRYLRILNIIHAEFEGSWVEYIIVLPPAVVLHVSELTSTAIPLQVNVDALTWKTTHKQSWVGPNISLLWLFGINLALVVITERILYFYAQSFCEVTPSFS